VTNKTIFSSEMSFSLYQTLSFVIERLS